MYVNVNQIWLLAQGHWKVGNVVCDFFGQVSIFWSLDWQNVYVGFVKKCN